MAPVAAIIPAIALITLVCAATVSVLSLARTRPSAIPSAIVWTIVYVALLVTLTILCGSESYEGTLVLVLLGQSTVLALCGALCAFRPQIFERLTQLDDRVDERVRTGRVVASPWVGWRVRHAAALIFASIMGVFALELPWNTQFDVIDPFYFAIEAIVVLLIVVALYFVGQRSGALSALAIAVLSVLGIAQYFVMMYRNDGIRPSDILAVGTAAEVTGQYDLTPTLTIVWGVVCAAVGICALALVHHHRTIRSQRILDSVVSLIVAGGCIVGLVCFTVIPSFKDDFDVQVDRWAAVGDYKNNGFIASFISQLQALPIEKPEGYTDETATATEDSLVSTYETEHASNSEGAAAEAQFSELQPTVIAIMNESFSDLSIFDGLGVGYEGPQRFNQIAETSAMSGLMAVDTYGGGTCNTEFEFLTGYSMDYIGMGKYPYQLYNFSTVDCLPRIFKQLGYDTVAMHPNTATNWGRNVVYPQMGFDEFMAFDSGFSTDTDPQLHSGISDDTCYQKILDRLATDSDPQFIFCVTMQNHGGYTNGDVSEELMPGIEGDLMDESSYAELNEFLGCIEASDIDLEWFVQQLSELDRPVALVFFGDHQPDFTNQWNNAIFSEEANDSVGHSERIYQTPYLVWANYDLAHDGLGTGTPTSAAYLGAQTLELIGAPLTSFQKCQIVASETVPTYNGIGYMDSTGTWHSIDEVESSTLAEATLIKQLGLVGYKDYAKELEIL